MKRWKKTKKSKKTKSDENWRKNKNNQECHLFGQDLWTIVPITFLLIHVGLLVDYVWVHKDITHSARNCWQPPVLTYKFGKLWDKNYLSGLFKQKFWLVWVKLISFQSKLIKNFKSIYFWTKIPCFPKKITRKNQKFKINLLYGNSSVVTKCTFLAGAKYYLIRMDCFIQKKSLFMNIYTNLEI